MAKCTCSATHQRFCLQQTAAPCILAPKTNPCMGQPMLDRSGRSFFAHGQVCMLCQTPIILSAANGRAVHISFENKSTHGTTAVSWLKPQAQTPPQICGVQMKGLIKCPTSSTAERVGLESCTLPDTQKYLISKVSSHCRPIKSSRTPCCSCTWSLTCTQVQQLCQCAFLTRICTQRVCLPEHQEKR